MPWMDGLRFIEQATDLWSFCKFLITTGVRDVQFGVQLAGGIQGETERMVGCFAEVGAEDDVREQVPAGGAGAVDDEHRAGGLLRHGAHRVAHDGAHTGGVGIAGGAARAHDDEIGLDLA